jgi:hypothetical protein
LELLKQACHLSLAFANYAAYGVDCSVDRLGVTPDVIQSQPTLEPLLLDLELDYAA